MCTVALSSATWPVRFALPFLCCRGVLSESVVSCELLLTGEKTDAAVTALLMLATGEPLHA